VGGRQQIRVITFDADQTLVDFQAAMRTALEQSLVQLRTAVPQAWALTVDDLVATRNRVADECDPGVTMEEIRRIAFARTLADLGSDDEAFADELTAKYLERRFQLAQLYDDVLPVLASLRSHYALGLASNGNSYPERSDLAGYFTFTVFAQNHAIRKPDPRFYRIVAAEARSRPHEVMHVGDSLRDDVHPAQSVGMRAVWLNRDANTNDLSAPWPVIATLVTLPRLLASGTSAPGR
jgi:FMN hydrolase / 5-amino-6-(5-phospho-D-ribitylamino)uracil phosphatase